ncbi:hypothetical protein [Enhygromyxa salina]|uniref:hypothetical protein n=1 Tax=Enhygromyxa salina TaxID=215803 RepID=UPI0011B1D7D7|nr:hypothetical protein [Enhygromyxa salina]
MLLGTGCVPDECTADFVVSGALDYTYALRENNSTCTATTNSSASLIVPGGLSWTANDGVELRITLVEGDLTIGTHAAIVSFYSATLSGWFHVDSLTGSGATCLVTITESEIVDWVQEDHRRVSGVLDCDGPLEASADDPPLYISDMSFSVYAGESPF